MNVNLSNAVRMFYGKSSYEMVYMEAIANALDAKATEISVDISASSKKIADTLQVTISDNGVGFTDGRFKKFSNLFDTEDAAHKGLGRLAYRFYFNDVEIESWYDNNKHRKFSFSDDFDGKSDVDTIKEDEWHSGTKLYLSDYAKKKLFNNSIIDVKFLKNKILSHFYLKLFLLKKQNIVIHLISNIDGKEKKAVISTDDIPDFKLTVDYEMFDKADTLAKTHHSVTNTLNLRSIKGNAPQAGNNYKITIIVNPTYLNVLTDNDADSELELD